jgi:ATP-dependent protease Clp ATPase subunit
MSTPVACQVSICSFCGKSQQAVSQLIGGPGGIAICNECVGLCDQILHQDPRTAPTKTVASEPYCVICGKAQQVVSHLISGQGGAGVCSECVDTCHGIVHGDPHALRACSIVRRPEEARTEGEGERTMPTEHADQ